MNDLPVQIPTVQVLGMRVHLVQIPDTLELLARWIEERGTCRYVVVTGMHGVMESRRHEDVKTICNSADLLVPDGISLVWVARRRGASLKKRVSGTDLMWEFFKLAEDKAYRVFFYGDTEPTLEILKTKLSAEFPRLKIVGAHSPPFRALSPEEKAQEVRMINESEADVVWVGLGFPKQERWMFENKDQLTAPVVVGVGAAFKFLSGQVRRAPNWVGDNGFEWLWRLVHEPRIVWRRVLYDIPRFAYHIALEQSGLRKYD